MAVFHLQMGCWKHNSPPRKGAISSPFPQNDLNVILKHSFPCSLGPKCSNSQFKSNAYIKRNELTDPAITGNHNVRVNHNCIIKGKTKTHWNAAELWSNT